MFPYAASQYGKKQTSSLLLRCNLCLVSHKYKRNFIVATSLEIWNSTMKPNVLQLLGKIAL